MLVDVDRRDGAVQPSEARGERAVTGAELEYGAGRVGDQRRDAVQSGAVVKEVLAEFVSAARGRTRQVALQEKLERLETGRAQNARSRRSEAQWNLGWTARDQGVSERAVRRGVLKW